MKYLGFITICLFVSTVSFCQAADPSDPSVIKGWTVLAESKTMIDISYRIVKCDKKQVHLSVFNENAIDQTTTFKVTITDTELNKSISKDVSMSIPASVIVKAECLPNTKTKDLKFDIPEEFDTKHLRIKITF